MQVGVDKLVRKASIILLCQSQACIISIIIDVPAVAYAIVSS